MNKSKPKSKWKLNVVQKLTWVNKFRNTRTQNTKDNKRGTKQYSRPEKKEKKKETNAVTRSNGRGLEMHSTLPATFKQAQHSQKKSRRIHIMRRNCDDRSCDERNTLPTKKEQAQFVTTGCATCTIHYWQKGTNTVTTCEKHKSAQKRYIY